MATKNLDEGEIVEDKRMAGGAWGAQFDRLGGNRVGVCIKKTIKSIS